MGSIDLELLLEASSPGGASCFTSVTELVPAGGAHTSVAPTKFATRDKKGTYAYERRYLDGEVRDAVLIDTKQSQLNRCEQALQQAIVDGHPVVSRLSRITVTYERDGETEEYSDLTLPHRAFDGHIRSGTVDGTPVTHLDSYRALRNATPANARALLETSPVSLIFGSWDSTRASRQGRWRSVLVGEIVGFCVDNEPALRGGARVDPVGMSIELDEKALKELAEQQRHELSGKTYDKVLKEKKPSILGLGAVPPSLETLGGVACDRIIRSHVLSFATLRQLRFGAGPDGDAACRALLAALALNALARSDAELYLRANCDLLESSPPVVEIDQRGGKRKTLAQLSIEDADALLANALEHAEQTAGVQWQGVALQVTGNPAIVAAAVDDEPDPS